MDELQLVQTITATTNLKLICVTTFKAGKQIVLRACYGLVMTCWLIFCHCLLPLYFIFLHLPPKLSRYHLLVYPVRHSSAFGSDVAAPPTVYGSVSIGMIPSFCLLQNSLL